jgi:hypothetical protein
MGFDFVEIRISTLECASSLAPGPYVGCVTPFGVVCDGWTGRCWFLAFRGIPGLIHNNEFPGCLTTGEIRSFPGSYGTRGPAEEALRERF